jgi:HEAT repeat protein
MDEQLSYLDHEVQSLKLPYAKQATELFNFLMKAVKAKLVYPSSSKLPAQFRDELIVKAGDIFKDVDVISYKVSSNSILYGDITVYESGSRTENFAHIFFRDGIIGLSFKSGLNEDELSRFVDLIAMMLRTVYIDDDMVTLLWEGNFQFIEYELVEDNIDIETVEYSVDSFNSGKRLTEEDIDKLFQEEGEITFDEGDFAEDSSLTESPFQGNTYNRIPQSTYDFLNHITEFTQAEQDQVKELLEEDSRFNHTEYLLVIIFEILGMEKEIPDYVETLEFIGIVRDDFIKRGNFAGASKLITRMHEMREGLSSLKNKQAEKIEGFFLDCASREKIMLVAESLNKLKDFNSKDLVDYLKQLPWAAIDPLLSILGDLEASNARLSVCSVLAEIGKNQIDLIARGLDNDRWYVVRNVVMVLGEIAQPKILNYLKKTIRHPDFRVRKETINAAAKIDHPDRDDFMILALSDQDAAIQMSSLNHLADKRVTRAFKALENIIRDKKFKDKPPEQLRKFLEAYAAIGQEKALPYLKSLTAKKFFIVSGRDERMRLYAIGSLAYIKAGEATETLTRLIQNKNNKVAMAAKRALNTRG